MYIKVGAKESVDWEVNISQFLGSESSFFPWANLDMELMYLSVSDH